MTNENNCPLCGCKLEARGKAKVEYEARKYGDKIRKVCKNCLTGKSEPTEEAKKK